ncbi:MAG: hypothetical protein GY851_11700 [bacterium]|nr:hypothetical protein [bacterium]
MEFLGLHPAIWFILAIYFLAMLLMGWFARRHIHDQNSYLLGGRIFNIRHMVMHSFGAGTNPGEVAGVVSKPWAVADYFEQRYGGYSSVLYVPLATLGMTLCPASAVLATARHRARSDRKLPWTLTHVSGRTR